MIIEMFNGWYFFWLLLSAGAIVGLYFLLRNRSETTKKAVLWSLLAFGLLLHFLKVYIPPYSVDEARMLRDSWFVNICGANIALFPFMFLSKNKHVKDYMFYIGVLSGLIALFYPQEPLAKTNQLGEMWDIIRFYYHHWMVMAVPLLMAILKLHRPSYKRVLAAPTGLLLLMLFIILNQIFQSELGFIPLRDNANFFDINFKNSSYIWGPGENDAIGSFLALFTPSFFKTIPVGEFAGQIKYWPWFWMIVPAYVLVTPLSFGLSMIFDSGSLKNDWRTLKTKLFTKTSPAIKNAGE
ncbi:MAG: YwaF family protein [Clostridia bacterium]|nr:YwaF family protein [Clostridia bacterium]